MSTHGGAALFLAAHMSTVFGRHPKHVYTERIVIAFATLVNDLLIQ